jgi:hypothetical protein
MRCGDTVKHHPTGQMWVVAYVEGEYLAWCGWPEGEAKVSDCTLVESVSDEQHLHWLHEVAKSSGKRARHAQIALDKIAEAA